MGLIERFTRKKDVDELRSLNEVQARRIDELQSTVYIAENISRFTRQELSDLKEKENWVTLSSGDVDERELEDTKRNNLRKECIKVFYKTPEGRAIIRNLVNYIVGKDGVNWTARDENPIVQKFIDDFTERPDVKFDSRQSSIVRRTLRDGECFLHLIKGNKGTISALRFYPPGEITEIEKDPNDSETVKSYHREYLIDGEKKEEDIKADEVVHFKFEVDEDVDRGRPLMENVIQRIAQYDDWLKDRILLNKVRSSFVGEKIVKGSPNRLTSASFPATIRSAYNTDEYAVQAPRPGTIIQHNESVEYKWTGPDVKAGDASEDGRQIRLSIAAGVGEPEYLLTSDASNSNYSSTMIAESPFTKQVEAFRFSFEHGFKDLFSRVIKLGIDGGSLPINSTETVMKESAVKKCLVLKAMKEQAINSDQSEQINQQIAGVVQDEDQYEERVVPTNTAVDFEWPNIVSRDLYTETQAVDVHFANKWVSKRTAQMRFGYDPDEEERLIAKEKEESGGDDAYRSMKTETQDLETQLDLERQKQDKVIPEI
jgi:hypothetical protein